MAHITIHAGLPKSGSSAVQAYLRNSAESLERQGVTFVSARPVDGRVVVERYAEGLPAPSGGIIHLLRDSDMGASAALEFVAGVHRIADECEHVVLSGEGLSQPFWIEALQPVREVFDQFGSGAHSCTFAMYLRPQHGALEAAWRQWGFRTGQSPTTYVVNRASHCEYDRHLESRAAVPNLELAFRPFVRNEMYRGDVVYDFAHHFLRLEVEEAPSQANTGLPLTVINMLAAVPGERIWPSLSDNRMLNKLRRVFEDVQFDDPNAARGRALLERWASTRFATSNQVVAESLGWDLSGWFNGTNDGDADIDELDALWRPEIGSNEAIALERLLYAGYAVPDRGRTAKLSK